MRMSPGSRQGLLALDDVSFEVTHGETLGIIGITNGSGKSGGPKVACKHYHAHQGGEITIRGWPAALLEVSLHSIRN